MNEETVRSNFARMAGNGFDPAQPYRWQHTVSGSDPDAIRRFVDRLAELGFVAMEPEPFHPPGKDTYVMSVAREQIHTPESLVAVCDELASLAEEYGVACGGYSVGWTTE